MTGAKPEATATFETAAAGNRKERETTESKYEEATTPQEKDNGRGEGKERGE